MQSFDASVWRLILLLDPSHDTLTVGRLVMFTVIEEEFPMQFVVGWSSHGLVQIAFWPTYVTVLARKVVGGQQAASPCRF